MAPSTQIDASQKAVADALGVKPEDISGAAWVILRGMAAGESIANLASALDVDKSEIEALIAVTLGIESDWPAEKKRERLADWTNGIQLLRLSHMEALNTKNVTWDQIEAKALERINNVVGSQSNVGTLLAIASAANKANRSGQGGGNMTEVQLRASLQSGNLGSIQLSLGARIVEQIKETRIEQSDRHIDANKMLTLEETREMIKVRTDDT